MTCCVSVGHIARCLSRTNYSPRDDVDTSWDEFVCDDGVDFFTPRLNSTSMAENYAGGRCVFGTLAMDDGHG